MGLVQAARGYIRDAVADLSDEEDFQPFLLCRNPDGDIIFTSMNMPGEPDKDAVADMMSAVIMVFGANEALFASCAWIVESQDIRDYDVMPSEHPDRKEKAFMLHVTPDGDGMYYCDIRRTGGKVSLSDWESPREYQRMEGRFNNAIRRGIALAANMPEELADIIDAAKRLDVLDSILPALAGAIGRLRETLWAANNQG